MRVAILACLCAVALAGRWHIKSNTTVNQNANGLSFWSKTDGMLVATAEEGLEFDIEVTASGGSSWDIAGTSYLLQLTDTAVTTTKGLVCGSNGVAYTENFGKTFNVSADENAGGCTGARRMSTASNIGLVGVYGSNNTGGLAVTTDGGVTFKYYLTDVMTVEPQNGAYPSATTWYISCGITQEAGSGGSSSGGSGSAADEVTGLTAGRVSAQRRLYSGRSMQMVPTLFFGQVLKTSDGGNSWKVVYNPPQGMEQVLGIDCSSETTCCHTAQAYNGTYIRCTYDGGNTWNVAYNVTGPRAALFDVRYFGSDWWAIGGTFATQYHTDCETTVLHSTDNGKTWVVDTTLQNVFGIALDIAADGSGAMFGVAWDSNGNNIILVAQ